MRKKRDKNKDIYMHVHIQTRGLRKLEAFIMPNKWDIMKTNLESFSLFMYLTTKLKAT